MSSILCSELNTGKNLRHRLNFVSFAIKDYYLKGSDLGILQIILKPLRCSAVKGVLRVELL